MHTPFWHNPTWHNRFSLIFKLSTLFLFFILLGWFIMKHGTGYFNNSNSVRILSWWGYLDNVQQMAELEAKCNTEIAVTEYMSLVEFPTLVAEKKPTMYTFFPGLTMRL